MSKKSPEYPSTFVERRSFENSRQRLAQLNQTYDPYLEEDDFFDVIEPARDYVREKRERLKVVVGTHVLVILCTLLSKGMMWQKEDGAAIVTGLMGAFQYAVSMSIFIKKTLMLDVTHVEIYQTLREYKLGDGWMWDMGMKGTRVDEEIYDIADWIEAKTNRQELPETMELSLEDIDQQLEEPVSLIDLISDKRQDSSN